MTQLHHAPEATATGPAADPAPHPATDRVSDLVARMTLEEKLAQIVGFWDKGSGEAVAPMQDDFAAPASLDDASRHGLGHLTRVYGTRPVDPGERLRWLWDRQRRFVTGTRLGIPAIVHEECLTGFAAWGAATFPAPTAWGAAFDPELVQRMGASIGSTMHALGVHVGLGPVLDVIRDPRWGRVEECVSEDPYLVGTVTTAYVRGLQSEGVHATLKHFVGHSGPQSGRNFGPVHAGPRELRDVFMVPFEMALLDGGARSVMPAYNEVDGVPVAADQRLLTDVLRGEWGFDGTVLADYFEVAFLHVLHGVAADLGDAAGQALAAGIDVELPTGDAYLGPLAAAVRTGAVDEALVDRACRRALQQKQELGLLDATFEGEPPAAPVLDDAEHREIARRLAEESVVLLANDGTLPLRAPGRVAVLGPNADRLEAMFGCYSFVNHVLPHHPGTGIGLDVPTVLESLRDHLPGSDVVHVAGCDVEGDDTSGLAAARAAAQAADVAVVVVGDQAGLFGRGTVGEGNDRESLELPGVQRLLVEEALSAGTPVVLVLLTGRPYAIGWALERCAAVVQAFFPGEEGGPAVAGVLTGRVNPSGRLPVSMPRPAGAQPFSYLRPRLGADSEVTNLSSAPALPFGHGLSYTEFRYEELTVLGEPTTDAGVVASVRICNVGAVPGDDVVQLYGHDVVASVTRPVAQLLGYRRIHLEPGEGVAVRFRVPPGRLAFTARDGRRVVEPGELELWVGTSADRVAQTSTVLGGEVYPVTTEDGRWTVTD